MFSIEPLGLISKPPLSKVIPLPIIVKLFFFGLIFLFFHLLLLILVQIQQLFTIDIRGNLRKIFSFKNIDFIFLNIFYFIFVFFRIKIVRGRFIKSLDINMLSNSTLQSSIRSLFIVFIELIFKYFFEEFTFEILKL